MKQEYVLISKNIPAERTPDQYFYYRLHFISLSLFHSLLFFIPFYFPFHVSLSHCLPTKDKAPSKRSSKSLSPVHFDFIFLNRLPAPPRLRPVGHHWPDDAHSLQSRSALCDTHHSWVAAVVGTAVVSVAPSLRPARQQACLRCPCWFVSFHGEGGGAGRPARRDCWTTGRKPLPLPSPRPRKVRRLSAMDKVISNPQGH